MDANTHRCMLRNGELIVYGSIFSFVIPSVIMIVMFILMVRKLRKQLLKLVDNNTEMKLVKQTSDNLLRRKLIINNNNNKNGKFLTEKLKMKKNVLNNMDEESCMTSPPSISSNNEASKTYFNNKPRESISINMGTHRQYQLRRHISTFQTARLSNVSNPSNISKGNNFFKSFFNKKNSVIKNDNISNALSSNSVSSNLDAFKTNCDMTRNRSSFHPSAVKSEVQNEVKGN